MPGNLCFHAHRMAELGKSSSGPFDVELGVTGKIARVLNDEPG
jgi:hypothetical protein